MWCVFRLNVINAVYVVFAINFKFAITKTVEEEAEEEKMVVKKQV